MGVNRNVFASRSEKENYHKLSRTWGRDYRIYHNLPFLAVFNPSSLIDVSGQPWKSFALTSVEHNRLKKTSVDYVLCDLDDRPLVCVEFDGLHDGFNLGSTYYHDYGQCPDPWRDEIMGLKLRVAHGSLFPYFVVGSQHFHDLTCDARLTIVDALVGKVLANRAVHARFGEGFDPEECGFTQEQFDALCPSEQGEIIQDWATGVEVQAEMERNPISRMAYSQLDFGTLGIASYSPEFVTYPAVPFDIPFSERIHRLDACIMHGTRLVIHTHDIGDVVRTVLLPNFKTPWLSELGISEELAMVLALDALRKMRGISS